MRIQGHSKINEDGRECIVVEVEPPEILPTDCSTPGFWANGGMYVRFEVNHVRRETEAGWMYFYRGEPQTGGRIKIWRNEIWTEEMCLKYCEENYGGINKSI